MADLECGGCGGTTPRLYATERGLLGSCCHSPRTHNWTGLHQVRLNKYGQRLTFADAMQIKTNKLRADGTYKPDPRWR